MPMPQILPSLPGIRIQWDILGGFFCLFLIEVEKLIYLAALGLSCGMWDLVP